MTERNWIEEIEVKNIGTFFNKIQINAKNMNVFAGLNTIGKTATCLHIADETIKKGFRVLYFDTENKIFDRPQPNLFKHFVSKNPDLYKTNFQFEYKIFDEQNRTFNLSFFKQKVESAFSNFLPDLIVIDSIYSPFFNFIPEPRTRARCIGEFVGKLRDYMIEKNFAIVLTTKLGKIVTKKENEIISHDLALGGQELLYYCDQKIVLYEGIKNKNSFNKKIIFVLDKQFQFILEMDSGGMFIQNDD